MPDHAVHWDDAYAQGAGTRSWFQLQPAMSLQMLDAAGVSAGDSVIDVGGGASPLVGVLLGRGFTDVTVLDISATGMQYARRRLGPQAERVRWLRADVLAWRPQRGYQVSDLRKGVLWCQELNARLRGDAVGDRAVVPWDGWRLGVDLVEELGEGAGDAGGAGRFEGDGDRGGGVADGAGQAADDGLAGDGAVFVLVAQVGVELV